MIIYIYLFIFHQDKVDGNGENNSDCLHDYTLTSLSTWSRCAGGNKTQGVVNLHNHSLFLYEEESSEVDDRMGYLIHNIA